MTKAKKINFSALSMLRGAFDKKARRELVVPGVDLILYSRSMTPADDERVGRLAKRLAPEGQEPSITDLAICTIIEMAELADESMAFDPTAAGALREEISSTVLWALYNGITAQPSAASVKKPSSEAEASSD